MWITIGHFEVDPVNVDAAHPDGYALGQEVGADSGSIARHRGFYIIDRSVPVGFQPGSRLNTDLKDTAASISVRVLSSIAYLPCLRRIRSDPTRLP